MKTLFFGILVLFLFTINFTGCEDHDNLKPIELKDREGTSISIFYPPASSGYSFPLQGGDGKYKIISENTEIVTAEMISAVDFQDENRVGGKAIIYPEKVGSKGIETTFKEKKIIIDETAKISTIGYEIDINNEKRLLFLNKYYPSTKALNPTPIALFEDITTKVQKEYPKAESVFTAQVSVFNLN